MWHLSMLNILTLYYLFMVSWLSIKQGVKWISDGSTAPCSKTALAEFSSWQGETGPCIHALPHLIVQIHEVPLEVMWENVVLTSAEKRAEKRQQESQTKEKVTFILECSLSLSVIHTHTDSLIHGHLMSSYPNITGQEGTQEQSRWKIRSGSGCAIKGKRMKVLWDKAAKLPNGYLLRDLQSWKAGSMIPELHHFKCACFMVITH